MAKKFLAIVETAFRGTLEEQDDPIIWLSHALKGAGTNLNLLLRGNAVNYGVRGQDASGLRFGKRAQTKPPQIDRDVDALIRKGADVYYVADDATARGIASTELLEGLKPVGKNDLASLLGGYDQVWHW